MLLYEKETSSIDVDNEKLKKEEKSKVELPQDFDEESYHAQKMESLGVLAGGMAHDMNNILASILAVASAMDAEMPPEHPYADDVKDILKACKRGGKLTKGLLSFARRHRVHVVSINANDIVTEVHEILCRTMPKSIEFELDLDPDLKTIKADHDQLNQVMMNICINAFHAMGDTGTLRVCTRNVLLTSGDLWQNPDAVPGEFARIVISDSGPGIPAELRKKVFEPFFSTKPKGEGTGLGLAMAYGTIKKHRGMIQIDEHATEGTSFIIDLPVSGQPISKVPPAEHQRFSTRGHAQRTGNILLVDDEHLFLTSSRRILEKLGYSVVCCRNGKEAVEVFETEHADIDLVILDMIMPVMGGRDTFYALKDISPQTPVLIASGFTEEANIKDLLENGAGGFIGKPFDMASLSDALSGIKA